MTAAKSYDEIFAQLKKSSFRAKFHLGEKERVYIEQKGIDTIRTHAADFIATRLAPHNPPRDGKQTPWRGHPVFIAQHACATCCRSCLNKWYGYPKDRALTEAEQTALVAVLTEWIRREMDN